MEYSTAYSSTGSWTSPPFTTGTKIGKVKPNWVADVPSSTSVEVQVSNDNGSTWLPAMNNQEVSFPSTEAGDTIRYAVTMGTTDTSVSPLIDSITMEYEEGYPDRPKLDIGNDLIWDWESLLFLNESDWCNATIQSSPSKVED